MKLTSNQHWGGLNNRFERRANRLRKLGFKYHRIDELNIAVFTRTRFGKVGTLSASALHFADNRSWIELMRMAGIR